jgi:glycosyltransferase involved in cell wall biosynthesis
VQQGWFSGTNKGLRGGLDPALGRASTLIDTHDYRRLARGSFVNAPVGNLPWLLREHGRVARRDPRGFVARRLETSYMFEHRSKVAREAIRATKAPFVLQTMTMFDAKTDDRPLFIYTDHTMLAYRRYGQWSEDLSGRERWIELERAAYAGATRIFTTSDFAKRSIVEDYGYPADRVTVAGSGTNIAVPERPIDRAAAPRRIAFIGKQWERKGGPILVEAFKRARTTHPDLELVIAGCEPELDEPGVTVLGRVEQDGVGVLLREADIFAMPSSVEPSAIVYSEASAHSLPILATTSGGTPERVIDGQTGLLSEPGDVDGLTENLMRLLDEPRLAKTLGQGGFDLVSTEFTWAAAGRRVATAIHADLGWDPPPAA